MAPPLGFAVQQKGGEVSIYSYVHICTTIPGCQERSAMNGAEVSAVDTNPPYKCKK